MNNKSDLVHDDLLERIDSEINNILGKSKDKKKDTLVMSGGGLKGFAHLGALHCLLKFGILTREQIKNISGSSAGSMVALLFIVGYDPLELFRVLKLINIQKTKNANMSNVITKFGLDDGSRLMLVLEKLIKAKGYDKKTTFKKLYKITGINLYITGTNVNKKKVEYFSHKTCPKMEVLKAVRISCSIPIVFTPVSHEGDMYVDGGCIDNYPISLFSPNLERVIGLYVTEIRDEVEKIKCIEDYLINSMECMMEGVTNHATSGYERFTTVIGCKKCPDTPEGIVKLFETGYNCVKKNIRCGKIKA